MEPEPNKKMEALLQACAQQRREQAGAPFEPHPATRRMLLAEAARKYPPPRAPGLSRSQMARRFAPKFALIGAGLALAAGLLWFSRPSQKVQLAQQPPGPSRTPAKREPAPETPQLHARQETLPATPAQPVMPPTPPPVAGSELRGASDSLAAAQSIDKAKLPVEKKADTAAPLIAQVPAAPGPPAARPVPAQNLLRFAADSPSAPVGLAAQDRQLATQRQRFKQAPARQTFADGEAERASAQMPVLNTFALEQTGSRIRIIDADGSIYEGELVASPQDQLASRRSAQPKQQAQRLSGPLLKQQPILERAAPARTLQEAPESASFRAIGTNRTLNLPVTFEATLVPIPREAPPPGGLGGALTAPGAPARAMIQGTVRIGAGAQMPIEAKPEGNDQ